MIKVSENLWKKTGTNCIRLLRFFTSQIIKRSSALDTPTCTSFTTPNKLPYRKLKRHKYHDHPCNKKCKSCTRGPGSSFGIATELRAGRSGIESQWGRDLPPFQTGPGAHSQSCEMGTGSFPGVKCGRGVLLTTHPLLVPRSWKIRAIPLPTLWATPGL